MNEISSAFGCSSLFIIWRRGRATSNKLASYVTPHSCVGKSINGLTDTGGKVDKALRQFIWCHFYLTCCGS